MTVVQFVGQSGYDRDNIAGNTSRLVNCYREPTTEGKFYLKSVLGMEDFSQIGGLFIRDMAEIGGALIVACGGVIWRIPEDGSVSRLFDVPDSPETTISSNNGAITVCAGGDYFLWNGTTATQPAIGAFEDFGSVEFLNHYTLLTERGGRRIQWSSLADPSDLPGLNFATADGRDDVILRGMTLGAYFWVFKEKSHEIWYNAGGGGAEAFGRLPGGVRDVGLADFGLICQIPGSLSGSAFMVGSNGRAFVIGGPDAQRVSTPAVETAIEQCRPQNCVAWEDEGRTFCAIVFRDCPAWVYDATAQEWHERAEGVSQGHWNVARAAKMGGRWFVGRNSGDIAVLRRTNRDGDAPLLREAVSETVRMDGGRPVLREIEVFARQGFAEGDVRLGISRDGGMTWTADKPRPMSPPGKYSGRLIWRNQGQARQFTARLRWTAPADLNFSTECRVVLS